jgi:acyl-CoA thioesterase YciA
MTDKIISMGDMDEEPTPAGELALQTIAMPKDTNANGDIFGGWLLSQMDLAGAISAFKVAHGRVATVAIDKMTFMVPVQVGAVISCYTRILDVGRSSVKSQVEVWMMLPATGERHKVTEGVFVYVAIGDNKRTRIIKP